MPRIFLPVINLRENQVSITGEKARYLTTVLRCATGDELIVFDGQGNCLRTRILKIDRREVLAEVLKEFDCNMESPLNIILVQGLLKGQKMDMVIQKATELGVKEVQPVITERTQPRETRKVVRWRKIAEEASRQSGRSIVPIIREPAELNQFLAGLDQLGRHGDTETRRHGEMKGFIFWEEGGVSLKEAVHKICTSTIHRVAVSPIHILIGPEGGFTKEEITAAEKKRLIVTTLGKRILRAETAAISAITLVQFLLGDLSY
jgi:16S rRNA (uracil1498-N3)-methyltransferase